MHTATKAEEMRLGMGRRWQSLVLLPCFLLPHKLGSQFLTAAIAPTAAATKPSAVDGSNATSQFQCQEELA